MYYLQFEFTNISNEQSDQLVALLHDIGFEGFEESKTNLKAFIAEINFDKAGFNTIKRMFPAVNFTKKIIENINWNHQWEKGFEPVRVKDFVAIRAGFHSALGGVKHDIIITPKMSFGTGHHATTMLMLEQMQHVNFEKKQVLDFGTGTGVLAILAEKLGAKTVLAIDEDEWSINNAMENILQNSCQNITILQTNTIPGKENFDIILANINLNVIISALSSIVSAATPGATICLSGFLKENEDSILNALNQAGLKYISTSQREAWILIQAENFWECKI